MQNTYPTNFNSTDFFNELSLKDSRTGTTWVWRKQFTKAVDSKKVLQEVLDNLWAAAVFDPEDNLRLKSLYPPDHNNRGDFDEALVIKDSVREPGFRNTNEIFQTYKLDYDFFPPADFSNALEEYRKRVVVSGDTVENTLSFLLQGSRDLYGLDNEKEMQFDYHYATGSLPMLEWLVRWFAFNSWQLKFKISLDRYLEGEQHLDLMDKISLKNFFYTRVSGISERVEGFVTSVKPDLYEGVVEIGMYVPEPPGTFNILCDPFNNALEIPSRGDVGTNWSTDDSSPEGRINTAPDFPRLADVLQKDAGNFPNRIITCF